MLYPDLSNTNLVLRVYTVGEKKKSFFPFLLHRKDALWNKGFFEFEFFFLPIQLTLRKSLDYSNFDFSSKFFTPIGIIHLIFLIIKNFKKRTIFFHNYSSTEVRF